MDAVIERKPQDYGINAELQEVFDHSFTGTYLACERMALYQNIWGRRGKEENFTLHWGKVFHKIAEQWQKNGNLNEILELIDLNIPEETDDRYGRNKLRMQEAFMEWAKFRRSDPLEILRTEQPATVACLDGPCPYSDRGCNLVYGGKLDEIVRWNAMVGPLDFKTTVMNSTDPVQEYKPNHQMEGYVWMSTHLTGTHCWGAIVERIVCNKSKLMVNRFPVPYARDTILEWVENEREVHAEIQAKFRDHPYDEVKWKQNQTRCFLPYACRFRDVCLSPREGGFRLRWLRDNTDENRFDFRKEDTVAPPMEGAPAE